MRISDWSSDVCSSDLPGHRLLARGDDQLAVPDGRIGGPVGIALALAVAAAPAIDVEIPFAAIDRASLELVRPDEQPAALDGLARIGPTSPRPRPDQNGSAAPPAACRQNEHTPKIQ